MFWAEDREFKRASDGNITFTYDIKRDIDILATDRRMTAVFIDNMDCNKTMRKCSALVLATSIVK